MQAWIVSVMEQFGYLGVFFMIALENIFPPIPSELILSFGGFMTTRTSLSLPGVIVSATAGSVFGAAVLYRIGLFLGGSKVRELVRRRGKLLKITVADMRRAVAWYEKYEYKAVFFCRMVPVLRSIISIPAGMAKMPFLPFLALTAVGSLIWNTVLVWAGSLLGDNWQGITLYVEKYSLFFYILLGAGVAVFIVLWLRKRVFRKNPSK
ncbi:DedA family protein [Papillibacter cinnamivorans]|uniref:Membrane protein DedA, SNARE-associated domain n=1 Tax=Papillibacter cinnamivorans DSM 12816 TaxID=1122930 RepID=A0A1W1ZJB0_9FIRM|nr:DedA family protein [Papillibacter cinnamivorans]SMC48615.1 membrane protein DedA, SNARE-associated domain [Papillibacter cinnamivorans DSM 12816]